MWTIQRHSFNDLDARQRETLRQLASDEFDHFPIVRETTWATPQWSFLGMLDEELACFYNLVRREVRFDGRTLQVAGLNNLVTRPACRGQGLAARLLQETTPAWFGALGATCGLLLCADALVPYYRRLGGGRPPRRCAARSPTATVHGRPTACCWIRPARRASPTSSICVARHGDRRHLPLPQENVVAYTLGEPNRPSWRSASHTA